jgi:hypothetical protein
MSTNYVKIMLVLALTPLKKGKIPVLNLIQHYAMKVYGGVDV